MSRSLKDLQQAVERSTDPRERADQIVRYEEAFHNEQAAYYDEIHSDPEPIRTYMQSLNREIHGLVRGADFVVDLCAGTGKSSLPILERGLAVVAIDVSMEMLRIYQRRVKRRKDLTVIHADATNPPLNANSCPAIMMIGGLHHIPDRARAVANACRALRPGGLLIIHEPLKTGQTHRLAGILRNLDAVSNPVRLARAVARRLGYKAQPEKEAAERLDFTAYERSFTSAEELLALIPEGMQTVDLRSRMALSDYKLGGYLRFAAGPLAAVIVAVDNWLSRTGRAGWTGNALWGVFRKPAGSPAEMR